jgi:hypothetical protein
VGGGSAIDVSDDLRGREHMVVQGQVVYIAVDRAERPIHHVRCTTAGLRLCIAVTRS